MITNREIANAANEWQLRHDVVEKDYVLGWLLAGIAANESTQSWAFKGGTCLRKCWFETYRFSEDLDFTVEPRGLEVDRLVNVFGAIGTWLERECGLRLHVDATSFRTRRNKRGRPTVEGRIGYSGPMGSPSMPKVKLDLTADEVIVRPLELRPVFHPFSDVTAAGHDDGHLADVLAYSLPELMGEKLRALAERCRPRDLYDVIHTHRHPDLIGRDLDVLEVLREKCAFAGIEVPTVESMRETRFRNEIETEWHNMLGHQLPYLPVVETFWAEFDDVFTWLNGSTAAPALASVPVRDDVTEWRPARYMTTWRTGAPLELIRFAGANRLKVVVDYYAERGRIGVRVVEPYSFAHVPRRQPALVRKERSRRDTCVPRRPDPRREHRTRGIHARVPRRVLSEIAPAACHQIVTTTRAPHMARATTRGTGAIPDVAADQVREPSRRTYRPPAPTREERYVGLITRRSQVQILPPPPIDRRAWCERPVGLSHIGFGSHVPRSGPASALWRHRLRLLCLTCSTRLTSAKPSQGGADVAGAVDG